MPSYTCRAKEIDHQLINELAEEWDLGDDDPRAQTSGGQPVYLDIDDEPYVISGGQPTELDPNTRVTLSP